MEERSLAMGKDYKWKQTLFSGLQFCHECDIYTFPVLIVQFTYLFFQLHHSMNKNTYNTQSIPLFDDAWNFNLFIFILLKLKCLLLFLFAFEFYFFLYRCTNFCTFKECMDIYMLLYIYMLFSWYCLHSFL